MTRFGGALHMLTAGGVCCGAEKILMTGGGCSAYRVTKRRDVLNIAMRPRWIECRFDRMRAELQNVKKINNERLGRVRGVSKQERTSSKVTAKLGTSTTRGNWLYNHRPPTDKYLLKDSISSLETTTLARNEAMKDSLSPDGVRALFNDPLPGNQKDWENCELGPISKWPEALTAHVLTVSNLPYPAAVLWGDSFILLHNQAWDEAAGIRGQGLPQKDSLSPTIVQILRSVATRRIPKEIQSRDLIHETVLMLKQASTAILSPLVTPGEIHADGILVQLLPKPMLYQSLQLSGGNSNLEHGGSDREVSQDVARAVDSKSCTAMRFDRDGPNIFH